MSKKFLIFSLIAFVWVSKDFKTLNSAIRFMNDLPIEQRESAYVIALSTRRHILFDAYSVVFKRAER